MPELAIRSALLTPKNEENLHKKEGDATYKCCYDTVQKGN
jgi:hypothetical protein